MKCKLLKWTYSILVAFGDKSELVNATSNIPQGSTLFLVLIKNLADNIKANIRVSFLSTPYVLIKTLKKLRRY